MDEGIKTEQEYLDTMYSGMQKAFRDAGVAEAIIPDKKAFEESIETGDSLIKPKFVPFQAKNAMFEGFRAEAYWWGPILIFPESAMSDLTKTQGSCSSIMGILALTPLSPFATPLAAILSLQWSIFALVDRGNGIKLRNTWATMLNPLYWIPTPI